MADVDDDVVQFRGDASSLVNEAARAADALARLATSSTASVKSFVTNINDAGDITSQVSKIIVDKIGVITTTLSGIGTKNEEVTQSFKQLPSKFDAAADAARRYGIQLVKLAQDSAKLAKPQPVAVDYGLKSQLNQAQVARDVTALDAALRASGLSAKELNTFLTKLSTGAPLGTISSQAIAVGEALRNLEKSTGGLTNVKGYLKDIINNLTTVSNLGARSATILGDNFAKNLLKGRTGTPQEILNVQTAGEKLAEAVRFSTIPQERIEPLFRQLGAGNTQVEAGAQGIAKAYLGVQKALEAVGSAAAGASAKQQNLIRESREGLDRFTGITKTIFESKAPPTVLADIGADKQAKLQSAYQNQLVKTSAEAQRLNVTTVEIDRAADIAFASGKIDPLNKGLNTLISGFSKLITITDTFGKESEKVITGNVNLLEQEKAILASLGATLSKQATTRAALPGAQAHVIESTKTAFGPLSVNATAAATQRYNQIVNKLSQDIASDTLKLNEYAQALDLVKNKAVIPAGTSAVVREATKDLSQLATTIRSATGATGLFHAAFTRANDVLRIFGRLEIYRAFSNLNNIIYESIRSAGEFGTKIALIQTITQDQAVGTNAWAESLKNLSGEFAVPVIEVASAAYETLSNQVTKSKADTEEFLQTVLEFGRTTGSKAPESVGIFTTAIKGFGRDVSESKDIAALFFNTIDFGRITAEGLNAVLGRTAPLARDLGVSLEEVSAGIVQLTLHGFNPQEAGTRVANFLLAFEKPSKEFKKYLAGFGVETGKDFITVSGGLAEAINRIAQAANSGNVAVKDLFPEIRKLQAALGLSTDGGKEYADTLDNITKKNDNYANAVKITAESPAQKAKQQLNELAIAGTALGTTLLGVFTSISDVIGGAATRFLQLSRIVVELGLVFASLKLATLGLFIFNLDFIIAARIFFIDLTAAIKAGTLASFLFTGSIAGLKAALAALASISPLKAFLASFTATYLLLQRIDESYDAFIEKVKKKVDLGLDTSFTSFKNNLNRTTEDVDRNSKEWHRLFSQRSADTTKDLEKQFATHEKLLDKIKDKSDIVFHSLTDVLHNNIQTIDAASKKASEYSKEAGVRIDQNNADYSKGVFDRQIATSRAVVAKVGFSGASQYETDLTVKRINDLRVQAKGFSKEFEINPLAGEKLLKTLDEAGKLLEGLHPDFLKKAIDRGSYQDIQNLLRLEQDILKAKQAYNAELERQRSIQAGIAADLKNKKEKETELVKDIENRFKEIRDFSNVDKEGNFVRAETDSRGNITKTPAQVAAGKIDERNKKVEELFSIIDKFQPETIEGLTNKAGLKEAILNQVDRFKKDVKENLLPTQDKQSGLAGQLDSVKSESIKLTQAFTDLTKAVNDQKAALFDREKERNEFIGQSERLAALIPKVNINEPDNKTAERVERFQDQLKHLEINPQNTAVTLETLEAIRDNLAKQGPEYLKQKVDLGPNKEGVITATTVEGLLDVIKANLQGIAGSTPIINEQVVKIRGINEQLGELGKGFNASRSSIKAFVDVLNEATTRISGIIKGLPNIPPTKEDIKKFSENAGTTYTGTNPISVLQDLRKEWQRQGGDTSYGSTKSAADKISAILDDHEEAANNLRKNLHGEELRKSVVDAAAQQGYPVGEITPSSIAALSKAWQGKPSGLQISDQPPYYNQTKDIINLNKQPTADAIDILANLRHEMEHAKQLTKNDNTSEIGASLGDIVHTAQVFKDHTGKALDYQVKLAPGITQSADFLASQAKLHGGNVTEGLATPSGQAYLKRLLDASGGDGSSLKGGIQNFFEPLKDSTKDIHKKIQESQSLYTKEENGSFTLKDKYLPKELFAPVKKSTTDAAKSTDNLAKSASSASNKLDDLQQNFSTPPYQEPQEPKPPEDINKLIGIKNAISDASLNPVIRQFEEAGQRTSSGITNDDYLRLALGNQQQYGGYINYYNKGFSPKGTDTIPAMLSPGEYVMPADKTSIYKGVLDSMRTGYYAGGGGVVASFEAYTPKVIGNYQNNSRSVNHSVNVGDINVNVSSTDGKSINGRTIAEQIRREIRTGGITKDFFGSQS